MIGSISVVALSFMVQEPSGIIDRSSAMSLVLEPAQVAQHRRLGAVAVEDRVGQVVADPGQRGGQRVVRGGVEVGEHGAADLEGGQDLLQVEELGPLVAGDAHVVGVDQAQVHPVVAGRGDDLRGPAGHPGEHGVEEGVVHDLDAALAQALGEHDGVPVGAPADPAQALGAVVDGVHAGDHGEQHLRGADVAGGLLAADVLLAGLEREPVRGAPVGVLGDAHQAARQLALEAVADRHVGGVRAAEAEGDAEALRGADRDVGAELAGRGQEGEGQQVGGGDHLGAARVGGVGDGAEVADPAAGTGILHEHPEALGKLLGEVALDQLDAERLGAGAQHRLGLRQRVGVHHEHLRGAAARAAGEGHRLGGGGGLVQQGGPGHVEGGQVGDDGLEVDQGLHRPWEISGW
ncbi:hypothetical protein GCM10018952_64650 [Streptosporangium vulgare]